LVFRLLCGVKICGIAIVQRIITSRKKGIGDSQKYDNIFCGLLRCPDCGYSLGLARNHKNWNEEDYNENFDFYCNRYRSHGLVGCSKHRISAASLYNAILADIKRLANKAIDNDKQMISSIASKLSKDEKDGIKQAERDLKKANKRLAELDRLFAKLFESHAKEEISDRNFSTLSASYEIEQKTLEAKIDELNEIIKTNRENGENAETFVDIIKNYADITELSQAMLNTLIDKIEVHEPEDIDGEYIQKIDVYYKFVGRID